MSHALKLERWLGQSPGPHGIGQAAVREQGDGTFALRHVDDLEAPTEALRPVRGLADLREVVKTDEGGAFRPLRGAPTLRRGWRMEGLSLGALLEALNVIYPAAVADWAAWNEGTLAPTEFAETARRQTGMYRIVQVATREQVTRTVAEVCDQGCLRRRLWRPHPDVAPGGAEGAAPGILDEFRLLCPEACNYFIAQARERIVADRKDAGE